ncbi:MAG: type II toxin-antitoxin system PemK/MazF family toxin [Bacteroidia bacterium]|nr:MAG: type II toxin-antitoxin system PemK/MazF family toxin [Bacteroidia bacterium]
MTAKKFEIWIANLDPRFGTEAGKTRPVLIIQTDSLNKVHPSTLVCPITTNIKPESQILRVNIKKDTAKVKEDCDVMIDQLRAIDKNRLIKRIGEIPNEIGEKVKKNLRIILDLDE